MRKRKNAKPKRARSNTVKPKKAPKKIKRVVTPRTRNGGTWTEAQFFQFIRAALRNKSRWWKPRLNALIGARRPSQSRNKRLKWEFQCKYCKEWWPQTQVEVHHEIPAGKLNTLEDIAGFVQRLFAEDGWVCTCKECHRQQHSKEEDENS